LFFVKFQHAARMLVGDLPLVAVVERARLELVFYLSWYNLPFLMAALLHFLTASVRAGLSMRSFLTHFLNGPSTSTARSIEGCSGEVTIHQMPCLFRFHSYGPVSVILTEKYCVPYN